MKKLSIIGAVSALVMITSPFMVFAQCSGCNTPPQYVVPPFAVGALAPIHTVAGIIIEIDFILGWFVTIFWILAVIFIFYAAFLYLTAAGDEKKVERATHVLKYAIIAVVVGLMAYGIPLLLESGLLGI